MPKYLLFITLLLTTTLSFSTEKTMSDTQSKVKLTTNLGEIIIQLNTEKAPLSSANFLRYVNEGFYNGTIFHRVIPDFMAQGGGFDTSFNQKTVHAPINNEANNGLLNSRGTLAMARTNDPNSATGQFFINYKDNSFLNHTSQTSSGWGYAVFGEVIEGIEVIDKIAEVKVQGNNRPLTNIRMKVTLEIVNN